MIGLEIKQKKSDQHNTVQIRQDEQSQSIFTDLNIKLNDTINKQILNYIKLDQHHFNLRSLQKANLQKIFNSTFPNSSWNDGKKQILCNQNDLEFNQMMLGEYQLAQRAIADALSLKNLPPHYEINFRIDLILFMTWDFEILFVVNGASGDNFYTISYDHISSGINLFKLCFGDDYISYFYRTEYTLDDANSDFSITFKTNCRLLQINGCEATSNESFAIGQVQFFVNECHFSCLACSGPLYNQCKLCFNNVNPTNGVCPQCQGTSNIFDNGVCVSQCSLGKTNKNQVCILKDQYCQSFLQNGYDCQQCLSTYYLWNGKCVIACPLFYDNINNICQDQIRSLPSNFSIKFNFFFNKNQFQKDGFVALEGLQQLRFSSFHIQQLGFSIQNLNSNNSGFLYSNNSMYTICGDIQLLGGFKSGINKTKISITVPIQQARKFIKVGFKFYLVDYTQSNPIPNIIVNLNGVTVQLVNSQYILKTQFNLCGFEQQDAYGEFKYVIADSTSSSILIAIENQSNFDIGIRDFIVGGYTCANTCQDCKLDNPYSCLSCSNGLFLFGDQCLANCPSGYYDELVLKSCVACSTTYPNCKICNNNQCLMCQQSFYFSAGNSCITCSQSPIKQYWNPLSQGCTTTCDQGLQPDDQNQICRNQCQEQACLICDQATQLLCQQCFQGYYLYNNSCVQSCPSGTSLDTNGLQCQSCNDPSCLFCNLDVNNLPICQKCINNKYLDISNNCQSCDSSCQTCSGNLPNQCSSCNSSDPNIVFNTDNTCTCNSSYYSFDSSTQKCKPICGDKFKTPEEECETFDNSFENAQGCDSNCKVVSGFKCFHQDPYLLDVCVSALCGDGNLDSSEQCDDGNNINGDGCSLDCKTEIGFNCSYQSGTSKCSSVCGDNFVTQYEECDSNDAGCDQSTCKIKINSGCSYTKYSDQLQISNCFQCNDQFCMKCTKIDPNQQSCLFCEENYYSDSISNNCLACDSSCKTCFGRSNSQCKSCYSSNDSRVILDLSSNTCICNSQYYSYDIASQSCLPICHDMYKAPEEECEISDPTLFENASGCVNCKVQSGFKCFSSPEYDLSVCNTVKCGDGIRDQGEECDDGNQIDRDSCSLNCKIQQGYSCSQDIDSSNLKCQSTCGDRIKASDEECDSADYGCTTDCKIMSNYGCYIDQSSISSSQQVQRCFKCQDANCLKCGKIFNQVLNSYDETCNQCQDGFQLNINSNKCEKCDSSCKTCNGPSVNNCTSCFQNANMVLDTASNQCTCVNKYYNYDITSNKCIPICGDKYKTPEEECEINDPSAFSNSLGCVQCKIQPGYKCIQLNNFLLDICMLSTCQNGVLDQGEECDDGNQIQLDQCSLDCKVNNGYYCSQTINKSDLICTEKCGDNIKTLNEECDPPGIGCSQSCQILEGFGCQQQQISNNLTNFQPTQCFKCKSNNCQKCEIVNNNVEICKICDNNYFLDIQSSQCIQCHPTCQSCKGPHPEDCISCPDDKSIIFVDGSCRLCDKKMGLQYNQQNKKCEELCGKGYMLTDKLLAQYGIDKTIECDDNNIANNDGCSQNCKIESGFKCINPINNQNLISQSLCTTLNDGPTPFLKLDSQFTHQQNIYQIQGMIYFDRDVSISSTKNITIYLDTENSLDYDVNICTDTVLLNNLNSQSIQFQIKLYKPINDISTFVKFKQSDITDKYNSSLLKKQINSKLPEIQALEQDIYGNNYFIISVLNALLGFISYFMLFLIPFQTAVTLFDLLQSVNYLKFLNVNYPKELYIFLKLFDFANFEFFPNINAKNSVVPQTFQREQIDSFFFSNIIQTVIIWALCLTFYLLSYIYKKFQIRISTFIDELMNKIYSNFFFKIASGIVVLTFYEISVCAIFSILFLALQVFIVYLGVNTSEKGGEKLNKLQNLLKNIQNATNNINLACFCFRDNNFDNKKTLFTSKDELNISIYPYQLINSFVFYNVARLR
ncbi:hypothetical protein ABPG72_002386 [Tetrahymena utriculariae]